MKTSQSPTQASLAGITLICLGSNYGFREKSINFAISALERIIGPATAKSNRITSSDVSGLGGSYINCLVAFYNHETEMDMTKLQRLASLIEYIAGRRADSKAKGQVDIDVDILVYDGSTVDEEQMDRPYVAPLLSQLFDTISKCKATGV